MDWAGPSVLPQKRQAKITAHYVRDTPWTGLGPRSFRKSDNSNCQNTVRTSCPTLRGGRALAPERLLQRLGPKPMKVFPSMISKRRIELHATLLLLLLRSVLLCFPFSAQAEVRFLLDEFSVAREWMGIA